MFCLELIKSRPSYDCQGAGMKCFADHRYDKLELNGPDRPISECRTWHRYDEQGRWERITEVYVISCECLWCALQREAEEIIAPGGELIADPKARNRAINAAYARLWLHDNRFQWAGLAAFASKQVGCGLLHASDIIERMQAEDEAAQRMLDSQKPGGLLGLGLPPAPDISAVRDYRDAREANPFPLLNVAPDRGLLRPKHPLLNERHRVLHRLQSKANLSIQEQFQYVYEMLALGNTTLFLDVFPLHAFYAKRGLAELKECLAKRANIHKKGERLVYWPVSESTLAFGRDFTEIIEAFAAVEAGDIESSVIALARHEQVNVLQRIIYSDSRLVRLLRGNQFSYVTNLPKGIAQPVELTLASQCRRLDEGRTIEFDDSLFANLADVEQRMPFVLRAASQFDELLRSSRRQEIERAIMDIAAGGGVE